MRQLIWGSAMALRRLLTQANRTMKQDTLLKWGGIAFLCYLGSKWLASRVSALLDIGQPRISLGAVEWAGPLPLSVSATIDLPITNRNAVSFPVDQLLANVVYGQFVLSSLQMTQPVVIQSGETTVLQFNTQLSFADLGGNIAALVASGDYLQALRLVGNVRVEGVTIPFSNTISIG